MVDAGVDPPGTWRSQLFPPDWLPVHAGAQPDDAGRFLPDFSFAGYHQGELFPPVGAPRATTITVSAALGNGTTDATGGIQAALDQACAAGGGVVLLGAGTYRLVLPSASATSVLNLTCSNLVLRGQGPSQTRLLFDDPLRARGVAVISVRGGGSQNDTNAARRWPLAQDVGVESRAVRLAVDAGFQAGDWVMVMSDTTEAFRVDHRMDQPTSGLAGLWPTAGWPGLRSVRQVAGVSGRDVTFTTPLRYPLKTRDAARVYGGPSFIREVGLESFSIGMTENVTTPSGGTEASRENDYTVEGTTGYQVHNNRAVVFDRMHDGWLFDVDTWRPPGNSSQTHLLSKGLVLSVSAAHVTIEGCDFANPQYRGGGGNGYLFEVLGGEHLFLRGSATGARHGYIINEAASGNVFREVEVINSRMSDDSHRFLAHANLYDRVRLDRGWLQAVNRGTTSTGAGFTATQHVFWGTHVVANHPTAQGAAVESAQWGWGYLIGSSADAGAQARLRADSFTNSTWRQLDQGAPEDWVEGVDAGASLHPFSLHAEQLRLRCQREARACVTW